MNDPSPFHYHEAFSRTLGWVTEAELQVLRHKRVAIAGAGGVGGLHLLTLTRLGLGHFHLADLDTFELANFNRQAGAMMSTLGQDKVAVMAAMARDINPELEIRSFPGGIGPGNVEAFLRDVDLYVDALDFFACDARLAVFAECARRGIPAITVAPLGMGAALVNFLPGGMTFDEYFGMAGRTGLDRLVRFMVGLAPRAPHARYLVEAGRMDLANQRGPSTPMGVQLCAGVAGSEALKILLGRGRVLGAPHSQTFDAYLNGMVHAWRPGGHRNPLTRLSIWLGNRILGRLPAAPDPAPAAPPPDPLMAILDAARWAPSGDNEQPWRFRRVSSHVLEVHFPGRADGDIYDYGGRPTLLSLGCLTESLRLAGTTFGLELHWSYRPAVTGGILRASFRPAAVAKEILADFLATRSVDRRPYRTRPLTAAQKVALEQAVGEDFTLHWLEGLGPRARAAGLNAGTSQLRNSIPETIEVHRRIIDWSTPLSPGGIPAQAIGASKASLPLLRWVLANGRRARFILGRIPGATLGAQVEMEWLPGLLCAGHFLLVPRKPDPDPDQATLRAGMTVQRFWLTAARLGLSVQPSVATLSFCHYGRHGLPFSQVPSALPRARALAQRFARLCAEQGADPEAVVFMGRIGTPQPTPKRARSVRKPLAELMATPNGATRPHPAPALERPA